MAGNYGSFRRPMMHIDRKDLYTNLESRILYLHSFLDFSSRDIEALLAGSRYIKALIPGIVNIVYRKLLQYDLTARAFQTRSTSYEGPVDAYPDENSPQIMHRKMFLRGYLNKLCSDPSTMEFWEYLDKVGKMHTGKARASPLHIEYIHIGTTLSFIQDVLNEALLSHPRLSLDRKISLVKAIGKVIWIQNDLFAKWYVRDGDEYLMDAEKEGLGEGGNSKGADVKVEPEGWVNGKKVLGADGEEVETGGVCPFTGVRAGGKKGIPVETGMEKKMAGVNIDDADAEDDDDDDESDDEEEGEETTKKSESRPHAASSIPRLHVTAENK